MEIFIATVLVGDQGTRYGARVEVIGVYPDEVSALGVFDPERAAELTARFGLGWERECAISKQRLA
jgi:hypothetical protein